MKTSFKSLTKGNTELKKNYKAVVRKKKKIRASFIVRVQCLKMARFQNSYVWYRSMMFFQVAFSSKWDTLAQRNYK